MFFLMPSIPVDSETLVRGNHGAPRDLLAMVIVSAFLGFPFSFHHGAGLLELEGTKRGLMMFFLVSERFSGRIYSAALRCAVGIVNIPKHTRQELQGLTSKETSAWLGLKSPLPPVQTGCGSGTSHSFLPQPGEAAPSLGSHPYSLGSK